MNLVESLKEKISNPEECYYYMYRFVSRSPYIEHSTGNLYTAKRYDGVDNINPQYARDGFSRLIDLIPKGGWIYDDDSSNSDRHVFVNGYRLQESDYLELCQKNVSEQMADIAENGIKSEYDKIGMVAVPLSSKGIETSEAQAMILKHLLGQRNLGYGNAPYDTAVLIEIPKDKIDSISTKESGTYIPSEYIKGAFYTEHQKVVSYSENPYYKNPKSKDEKNTSSIRTSTGFKANSSASVLPKEVMDILDEIFPREQESNVLEETNESTGAFSKADEFDDIENPVQNETPEASGRLVISIGKIGRKATSETTQNDVKNANTVMQRDGLTIVAVENPYNHTDR